MEKLKCKCSKCGREFSVGLPDDEILRQFIVTCRDCATDMEEVESVCESQAVKDQGVWEMEKLYHLWIRIKYQYYKLCWRINPPKPKHKKGFYGWQEVNCNIADTKAIGVGIIMED